MPRKKHRRKPSPLTVAKNKLRGSSNKTHALSKLRETIDYDLLDPIALWSSNWFLRSGGGSIVLVPRRIAELRCDTAADPLNLEREVGWAAALIRANKNTLAAYLQAKSALEDDLLTSSPEVVLDRMDNLESVSGLSLTSLSLRIALLQHFKGLQAQKDFVVTLRTRGASPMLQFFAYWWSVRAEESTTASYFVSDIERRLLEWDVPDASKVMIRHQLLAQPPTLQHERHLLCYASFCSAVDAYEAFIAVATAAVVEERESRTLLARGLEAIRAHVSDRRIDRILALNGDPNAIFRVEIGTVAHQAAGLLGDRLTSPIHGIEEFAAASVTAAQQSHNPLAQKMSDTLNEAKVPGDVGSRVSADLAKLGLTLGATDIGRWTTALARAHIAHTNPVSKQLDATRFVVARGASLQAFSSLPQDAAAIYVQRVEDVCGVSAFTSSARVLTGRSSAFRVTDLSTAAEHDVRLWRAAIVRDTAAMLELTEEIPEVAFSRADAYHRVDALLTTGRVADALHLTVRLLHARQEIHSWLPLQAVVEHVYVGDENRFPALISTPLLLYYYAKFVEQDGGASLRSYTAEDFLRSRGVDRPSEFSPSSSDPPSYVVSFLADVCSPTTLRLFLAFSTQRELEDERIAVCQILAQQDADNRDVYESEVRALIRSRVISDALKQLQASKISIDEESLSAWAVKHLREDFDRYQALLAKGLVVVDDEYRKAVIKTLETGTVSKSLYDVPANEASALFTRIVTQFVDQCAFDPEHGLDCYLSLRIRHGTLSGLLRSASEKERVVTKRASETGSYRPNTFWHDATKDSVSDWEWSRIEQRLAHFSKALDSLIAETAREYIQIFSSQKPKGLFNITIPAPSVFALALDLRQDTTFEQFVRLCLDLFWAKIEASLSVARGALDTVIRDLFRALFDELEQDLRASSTLVPIADAVLRARIDTNASIDRLMGWFELPGATATLDFTLAELVEVAMEEIRSFHRDFAPTITGPEYETRLRSSLHLFTDIFFVIFENIYTHCGATNPDIRISARSSEDILTTRIENSVTHDRCTAEQASRVEQSRRRIESGAYLDDVSREGGTGFPKIAKLTNYKAGKASLDFGLDNVNCVFWVEFKVPFFDLAETEARDAVAAG